MSLKEDLGSNKWPMAGVVKLEPDLNSVELQTVNLLNNQMLLHRPINKIVLLAENEMVRFPPRKVKMIYKHFEGSHF